MDKKEKINDLFSSVFLIIICIIIISPFVAVSFMTIKFLVGLITKNILAINFFALLGTLIFSSYAPDNIIIKLSPIIESYVENNCCYQEYKEGYFTIFLFLLFDEARLRLRLKLIIYAAAFILVLFTNIQDYGLRFIQNKYLNDIRVVINGVFLTFIAFDRFVKEFENYRKKLKEKYSQ